MKGLVVHHHLGLGDHFICNGLVNHLAETHDVVHLPCKRAYYATVSCLYSEEPKVEVFAVDHEATDVAHMAGRLNAEILRVGFGRVDRERFDVSFYEQLGIPFEYRYSKFKLPSHIPHEDDVFRTLTGGHERYCLVHREGSPGTYALRFTPSLPVVDINRRAGAIFENLLGYRRLIQRAAEIHCVNSSVIHLVESIGPPAALYYHDVRKRNFQTRLPWRTIEYRPRWAYEAAARARRLLEH
jgi:hypothetical protein